MPRLTPQHWKTLVKVFEQDGFVFDRENSSHLAFIKKGIKRPIIIPKYNDVGIDIIKGLLRTANISRKRYFELL